MTKHTDYFHIILPGQYPIDFNVEYNTQSQPLIQDLTATRTAPDCRAAYTWEGICQHIAERRGPPQVDRQIIAKKLGLHMSLA